MNAWVAVLWGLLGAAEPPAAPPAAPAVAVIVPFEPWHLEPLAPNRGVRVMTARGRAISQREGLASVGLAHRLEERAQRNQQLDSGLPRHVVQRVLVLGVAGALVGAGVLAMLGGLGVLGWYQVAPLVTERWLAWRELPRAAPILLILGGATTLLGVVGLLVGAAYAAWLMVFPPAPQARLVEALGASVLWDPAEAEEVVRLHNALAPAAPKT